MYGWMVPFIWNKPPPPARKIKETVSRQSILPHIHIHILLTHGWWGIVFRFPFPLSCLCVCAFLSSDELVFHVYTQCFRGADEGQLCLHFKYIPPQELICLSLSHTHSHFLSRFTLKPPYRWAPERNDAGNKKYTHRPLLNVRKLTREEDHFPFPRQS